MKSSEKSAAVPTTPARPQVSWLPLAFILPGILAFLSVALWLAVNPSVVLLPFIHPTLLALVHLCLPGGLLSICLGALYQLAPVVLGAPLSRRPLLEVLHLLLHGLGIGLLVNGFLGANYGTVALGGSLVFSGALLQTCRLLRLFAVSNRRDAIAWSLPTAALWLVATTGAGVVLALNHRYGFLPLSTLALLRAHAHAGLIGFFATLLQGVAFQLLPMFTLADIRGQRVLFPAFLATQAGLLVLLVGLACELPAVRTTGVFLTLLGLGSSALALFRTYQGRRRRRHEPALKAFGFGTVATGLAALLGALLPVLPLSPEASIRLVTTYGVLLAGTGLPLLILGVLFKILPFLVWMIAYGPAVGKRPVPVATSLGTSWLQNAWLTAHLASFGLLALGSSLGDSASLWLAPAALIVSAGFYLCETLGVLSHLLFPRSS